MKYLIFQYFTEEYFKLLSTGLVSAAVSSEMYVAKHLLWLSCQHNYFYQVCFYGWRIHTMPLPYGLFGA